MFENWDEDPCEHIGVHSLVVLANDGKKKTVEDVARALPKHYVSNRRYADILEKLGKPSAADYLRTRLPTTKATKSGELGEILGLTFVEERTRWGSTIQKLRWKDSRNMPMRGDDVLAVSLDGDDVTILKGEAKSRKLLSSRVLKEAHQALEENDGRPSPHALAFYSDRLAEDGQQDLADAIDRIQYKDGLRQEDVSHMIFVFSGNDPKSLLRKRLCAYDGNFEQVYVGAHVAEHAKFVKKVFKKVGVDGNN